MSWFEGLLVTLSLCEPWVNGEAPRVLVRIQCSISLSIGEVGLDPRLKWFLSSSPFWFELTYLVLGITPETSLPVCLVYSMGGRKAGQMNLEKENCRKRSMLKPKKEALWRSWGRRQSGWWPLQKHPGVWRVHGPGIWIAENYGPCTVCPEENQAKWGLESCPQTKWRGDIAPFILSFIQYIHN